MVGPDGNVAERLSSFDTSSFFLQTIGLSLLLALTTLVSSWSRRFSWGETGTGQVWPDRALLTAPLAASVFLIFFVVTFGIALSGANALEFQLHWPNGIVVTSQWIALFFTLSVLALVAGLPFVWSVPGPKNSWAISKRLHYSALTLSLGVFLILMLKWNMVGFQY